MYDEEKNEFLDSLPKRKPNTDVIDIKDVGGISHYTYNIVRYKRYRYDDDVDLPNYGIRGKVIAPYKFEEPETQIDLKKNGKEILLSIYNLACDINEGPYKGKKNTKSYIEKIISWCEENFHPYDIDLLFNKYKKTLHKGEEREDEPDVIDGTFEVNRFMKDLQYVYQAFTYIIALQELLLNRPLAAYNLYKEGYFFDTLSFFEIYKSPLYSREDDEDEYDKNEDLLKAMQRENEKDAVILAEYYKLSEQKKLAIFKKNALSNKVGLYQDIISFFPDIPMHLKYDFKNKGVGIIASIDSVFDICWYTMARMLTFYGLSDNDRTNNRVFKDKQWYYDEGTYGTCLFCGKPFLKTGNRQKYCTENEECQKARKRKNSRDHYKKILINKSLPKKYK